MMQRQLRQNALSPGREFNLHFAPVCASTAFLDQTSLHKPVYQFDGAVVLELKALSDISDGGPRLFACTFHGEHQLMVLRFKSRLAGRFLAEAQETADSVPELGQGLVVGDLEIVDISHK
jgi:hypothetical protein